MRSILLVCPLLLAGCVATAPITQPPVAVSFQSTERTETITGVETVTVRARLQKSDQLAELGAVPCRLSGPGYTAAFRTPAVLELPLFGNNAPQLSLSCTFEGETKTRALRAINVSERQRREARRRFLNDLDDRHVSGARIFLGIGLNRTGRGGFDEFNYPNTAFTFQR
ncbi:MAG: hypothetical protein AAGH70_12690 [Pseudomonadota bacterium]